MKNISEILSLARFDHSSDKNAKYYGAVKKQHKKPHQTDNVVINDNEWQDHDRREGTDRRSSDSQRNKRFELRNKNDRRKAKSISITA